MKKVLRINDLQKVSFVINRLLPTYRYTTALNKLNKACMFCIGYVLLALIFILKYNRKKQQ